MDVIIFLQTTIIATNFPIMENKNKKNKDDIFILSNGHAEYALYSVLEKYYDHIDADDLVNKMSGDNATIEANSGFNWNDDQQTPTSGYTAT